VQAVCGSQGTERDLTAIVEGIPQADGVAHRLPGAP
jgi:hypothetical protein